MRDDVNCDEVMELAPELALGIAAGAKRPVPFSTWQRAPNAGDISMSFPGSPTIAALGTGL